MEGAAGWQLSNAQVLSMAAHRASLDLFDEIGMPALRKKGLALSGYLMDLLAEANNHGANFNVITPRADDERGCQVSILTGEDGKALYENITKKGVICDWREPNVIRVAPVPMYNSFEDVYRFVELLKG